VTGCANGREALSATGLARWNIRKVHQSGTAIILDGATSTENPEKVSPVRTDPRTGLTRCLSTVGKDYGVQQNEDSAAVLDALVAESGVVASPKPANSMAASAPSSRPSRRRPPRTSKAPASAARVNP